MIPKTRLHLPPGKDREPVPGAGLSAPQELVADANSLRLALFEQTSSLSRRRKPVASALQSCRALHKIPKHIDAWRGNSWEQLGLLSRNAPSAGPGYTITRMPQLKRKCNTFSR